MRLRKISKAHAKLKGEIRYYTGKLCKHGHKAERYVKTSCCVMCSKEASAKFYREGGGSEKQKEYAAKHRAKMKEKYNTDEEYRESIKAKQKAARNARREKLGDEEFRRVERERCRAWHAKNPEKAAANAKAANEKRKEEMGPEAYREMNRLHGIKWRAENREKYRKYQREYQREYMKDPEHKDKRRIAQNKRNLVLRAQKHSNLDK